MLDLRWPVSNGRKKKWWAVIFPGVGAPTAKIWPPKGDFWIIRFKKMKIRKKSLPPMPQNFTVYITFLPDKNLWIFWTIHTVAPRDGSPPVGSRLQSRVCRDFLRPTSKWSSGRSLHELVVFYSAQKNFQLWSATATTFLFFSKNEIRYP